MADIIQWRRGTAAQWTSANPVLASGEMGLETDTNQAKAGDGTTPWNSLPYNFVGPQGDPGQDGANGSVWYSGDGPPASGLGVVGDWYLDNLNGDYYEKTSASVWTPRGNLTGPQGPQGPQGDPGTPGEIQSSNDTVFDIIGVTQAEYDGLTPVATTLYLITG
jgi:hypothetical protein